MQTNIRRKKRKLPMSIKISLKSRSISFFENFFNYGMRGFQRKGSKDNLTQIMLFSE
jgi:hypothetical protein